MATIGSGQAVDVMLMAALPSPLERSESKHIAMPNRRWAAKRTHDHLL